MAACIVVGLVGASAARVGAAEIPPLPAEQRVRLDEAFHLVGSLGPEVWRDFDGHDAPVVLCVGDVEYLLDRSLPFSNFEPVPGDRFLDRPVFARPRGFSPALLATFPIDGVTSVVIGTAEQTERTPTSWVLTLAHELFHVFQAERGLDDKVMALAIGPPEDPDWHLNFPFPYDDEAVRNAMHLLGYSLFRTLQLAEDADAAAVLYDARVADEALHNLFTVLELRFDEPRNVDYFRYQTGKEGVARYVEYRLTGLAASAGYEPLPAFVASEGPAAYGALWTGHYESGLLNTIKHAGRVSGSRIEFYSLGLGLALTLDRVQPDWKAGYFDEAIWLDDLLNRAVGRDGEGCRLPRRGD